MIIHTQIAGTHLAGNLWGDPTERDLFVYLPSGYDESERRYPTAYLLHAYGDAAELMVTPATDGERWWPPTENPGNHGGRANERFQVALESPSQTLDGEVA